MLQGAACFTEYGVHPIYLTEWFLGKIARVTAFTGTTIPGLTTEDVAIATLESQDNSYGVIDVNLNGPFPLWDDHLEFVGTKGLIIANGAETQPLRGPPLMQYKDDGIWRAFRDKTSYGSYFPERSNEIEWDWNRCFLYEIQEFVSSVLEDRRPLISSTEGRSSIQVLQRVASSARTGKAVSTA